MSWSLSDTVNLPLDPAIPAAWTETVQRQNPDGLVQLQRAFEALQTMLADNALDSDPLPAQVRVALSGQKAAAGQNQVNVSVSALPTPAG